MSTTNDNILRGVAHALNASGITLPVDLRAAELAEAPFAGDPATEFLKRLLDPHGAANHRDAYARLAPQVSPSQAAHILTEACAADTLVGRFAADTMVSLDMLPLDETLFDLFPSTGDSSGFAQAAQAALIWSEHTISSDAFVDACADRTMPASWVLSQMAAFHLNVSDSALDRLSSLVAGQVGDALAKAVPLTRYRDGMWVLTDEQASRLARSGTLADLVIAARLGRCVDELLTELLAHAGAVALLAQADLVEKVVYQAMSDAVTDRPDELVHLPSSAIRWLLTRVTIADAQLLLDLLEAGGHGGSWLTGSYPLNLPTLETVRAALARGLVDGARVVGAAAAAAVRTAPWFPTLVTEAPGIAPALTAALDRHGRGSGHDSATALGLAAVLAAAAGVLGDDERLWQRMLGSGTPDAPFSRTSLTLAAAAAVYRDRWAQAEERRAGRGPFAASDYRNCVTGHTGIARHPRSQCPAEDND